MIGSTLSYDALGSLVLCVTGDRTLDREEWKRYVAHLKERAADHPIVRVVVFTGAGAPDSVQRQLLTDAVPVARFRGAVVSDSLLARGVITAFRWYGLELHAFKSSAIEEAYRFVGATSEEKSWLRSSVARARTEPARRAAPR